MKIMIEIPDDTIALSVTALQENGGLQMNTRVYGTEEVDQMRGEVQQDDGD